MNIFLSYCRDNKPFADRLYRDLQRAGLAVWMDDQIPNDVRWNDVLKQQIANCDVMLLLASPEAADPNRFVVKELAEAERLGKRIVRLRLCDVNLLPETWRDWQLQDFSGRYWSGLPKLLADFDGKAVASPLDLLDGKQTLGGLGEELRAIHDFSISGQQYAMVPVLPSAYGMVWLAGPKYEPIPIPGEIKLDSINIMFRFTGKAHDETYAEVLSNLKIQKRSSWMIYVQGPMNDQQEFVLPNINGRHIWNDTVGMCERAVREWIKGRHCRMCVFFNGPAMLAFAVGSRLREMVPYELFNYDRELGYVNVYELMDLK